MRHYISLSQLISLGPLWNCVALSEDTAFSFCPAVSYYLKLTSVSQVLCCRKRYDVIRTNVGYSKKRFFFVVCLAAVNDVNVSWRISEWSQDVVLHLAETQPQRTEAKVQYMLKAIILTVLMTSTTPTQVLTVGTCQTDGEFVIQTHGCDYLVRFISVVLAYSCEQTRVKL